MDTTTKNSSQNSVAVENTEVTKVCKSCGRQLPLSAFHLHNKSKDGHGNECKECSRRRSAKAIAKNAKSNPLAQFTARQLMIELNRRGYEGTLEYVELHKVNKATL